MNRFPARLLLTALLLQPCLFTPAAAQAPPVDDEDEVREVQTPEPTPDQPIAQLGKRTIRYRDFTRWLRVLNRPQATQIRASPTVRKMAMKQYFYTLILSAKGQQERVQDSKAYQEVLAVMKQEAFARAMMDETLPGSVASQFKHDSENIPDSQLQAYLEAHRDQFDLPERFTIRYLTVSFKGTGAPGAERTDAQARNQIARIQGELKNGRSFADLAKDDSDDLQSKNQGGHYTDLPYGRLPMEVEEAIRTQALGTLGEPIKSIQGYHLVLVEARKPREAAVLDERTRDLIRRQMVPGRRAALHKEYVDRAALQVGFKELNDPAPRPANVP